MKTILFFLPVSLLAFLLFTGCGNSVTLGPGERKAATLSNGTYMFNTVRTSEDEDGSVFYNNGLAKVTNEAGGYLLVQLLDEWGGWFRFRNNDGKLSIIQSDISYHNLVRDLKGDGVILTGNRAKGTCKTSVKATARITRDWREGEWTLDPVGL